MKTLEQPITKFTLAILVGQVNISAYLIGISLSTRQPDIFLQACLCGLVPPAVSRNKEFINYEKGHPTGLLSLRVYNKFSFYKHM